MDSKTVDGYFEHNFTPILSAYITSVIVLTGKVFSAFIILFCLFVQLKKE